MKRRNGNRPFDSFDVMILLDRGGGGRQAEAARDQARRELTGAVVAAIQQFEGREPRRDAP